MLYGIFPKAGQRVAPVRDYADVVADPSVYDDGYLVRTDDPTAPSAVVVGSPVRLSATPTRTAIHPPGLGEHTEQVLVELGYSDGEIAALLADGTC